MTKNDSEIMVHLPADKQQQFKLLAERQGLSCSQFGRALIVDYLDKQKAEFEYMKSVFE